MWNSHDKAQFKKLSPDARIAIIDDALKGVGVEATNRRLLQEQTEKLNEDQKALGELAAEIAHQADAIEQARPAVEMLASSIRSAVVEFRGAVYVIKEQLDEARRELSAHQLKFGLQASKSPNKLLSTGMIGASLGLEAIFTAMLFYSDGAVPSFIDALINGFIIAGINVGISAFVGGFLCGRHFNYHSHAIQARRDAQIRRFAARTGTILVIAFLAWMHITVGVVRATGDFENVAFFDFQEWAFKTDVLINISESFFAQSTMALGIFASIVAWTKGLSGFTSRDPASAAILDKVDGLLDDAHWRHDEIENVIKDFWDDAIESIDEGQNLDAERREEFERKKADLISDIRQAKIDYETAAAEASATYRRVDPKANGESEPFIVPDDVWESFMPDIIIPDPSHGFGKAQRLHSRIAEVANAGFRNVEKIWGEFHDQAEQPLHEEDGGEGSNESSSDGNKG